MRIQLLLQQDEKPNSRYVKASDLDRIQESLTALYQEVELDNALAEIQHECNEWDGITGD